ncbi:MAG: LamG domain-containing protein [Thermoguttaceae bacterium]
MRICLVSMVAFLLLGVSNAFAAVVGYWQFDDRSPGWTADVVVSQVGGPSLDGTASGVNGGAAPTFSADVPGTVITDGLGGPVINAGENTASLRFVNSGDANSGVGGQVSIPDVLPSLKLRDFTIEAFIKIDRHVNYPSIVGKSRDGSSPTWLLDTNNNGTLRARIDSQPLGGPQDYSQGYNQGISTLSDLEDEQWHHVAATYLDSTQKFTLYVDYVLQTQATTIKPIVYTDNPLLIGQGGGGRAFDGWIDEVRYTSGALAPDGFLRAAFPEPSTAVLTAIALLGFGLYRWRARTV